MDKLPGGIGKKMLQGLSSAGKSIKTTAKAALGTAQFILTGKANKFAASSLLRSLIPGGGKLSVKFNETKAAITTILQDNMCELGGLVEQTATKSITSSNHPASTQSTSSNIFTEREIYELQEKFDNEDYTLTSADVQKLLRSVDLIKTDKKAARLAEAIQNNQTPTEKDIKHILGFISDFIETPGKVKNPNTIEFNKQKFDAVKLLLDPNVFATALKTNPEQLSVSLKAISRLLFTDGIQHADTPFIQSTLTSLQKLADSNPDFAKKISYSLELAGIFNDDGTIHELPDNEGQLHPLLDLITSPNILSTLASGPGSSAVIAQRKNGIQQYLNNFIQSHPSSDPQVTQAQTYLSKLNA